jgi:hypothetical protein
VPAGTLEAIRHRPLVNQPDHDRHHRHHRQGHAGHGEAGTAERLGHRFRPQRRPHPPQLVDPPPAAVTARQVVGHTGGLLAVEPGAEQQRRRMPPAKTPPPPSGIIHRRIFMTVHRRLPPLPGNALRNLAAKRRSRTREYSPHHPETEHLPAGARGSTHATCHHARLAFSPRLNDIRSDDVDGVERRASPKAKMPPSRIVRRG